MFNSNQVALINYEWDSKDLIKDEVFTLKLKQIYNCVMLSKAQFKLLTELKLKMECLLIHSN